MKQVDARRKQFVSEAIVPVDAPFAVTAMCAGEPGLPMRFRWRGSEFEIVRVLEKWKTTGPCRNGSSEQYVRRHCYRVEVTDGTRMELYFDRQPRPGQLKKRWWLASVRWGSCPRD